MAITFSLVRKPPAAATALGVPVCSDALDEDADAALEGTGLAPSYVAQRGFEAKAGQTLAAPGSDGTVTVLVGMGEAAEVDVEVLRKASAALVRATKREKVVASDLLAAAPDELDPALAARAISEGTTLAAYKYTEYKSDKDKDVSQLSRLAVIGTGRRAVRAGLELGNRVGEAVNWARDLVNEPGGSLTPSRLAEEVQEMARREGLKARIMREPAIRRAGLGGLLGVNRGSTEEPRFIELGYEPEGEAKATIALVGKGITFDSGGLSIKPAQGMMTMKTDMGGAAAVLGAMSAVPALGPDVNVRAYVPATDNMPSGDATRPGDVLTIRGGKTVEVLNTDAEGRLILADGLVMASEAEPDAIIDLATLTGACMVALGNKYAGLMGNDDALVEQVRAASDRSGELVWQLPLPDGYRKQLDSPVADVKNIGGPYGGALTAGLFLREFVGEGIPWGPPRHRRTVECRRRRRRGGQGGDRFRGALVVGADRQLRGPHRRLIAPLDLLDPIQAAPPGCCFAVSAGCGR